MTTLTQTGNFAAFLADQTNVRRDNGHTIAWDFVSDARKPGTAYTVAANGAAAAGAESITVQALPVTIPAGTALDFGVHSTAETQMLAITTVTAAAGATELACSPLPVEIEDAAAATYRTITSEKKVIEAGTIMAMLAGGGIIPVADATGDETAFALLAADQQENRATSALSGAGVIVAAAVYENRLPDYGATDFNTWKTQLAAAGSFQYRTWNDNTV